MYPTPVILARRTFKFLLRKKDQLSPFAKYNPKSELEFQSLSKGRGYHKYEIDFLETFEWTAKLLENLVKNKEKLLAIAKAGRAFEKPDQMPVCILSTDFHSFDFSQPEKKSITQVGVKVSRLNLNTKERHSLIVLAGEKYDPYTDSVILSAEEDDRHQVLATCQQQLNNLIKAAKENDLTDVKVDLRHVKLKSSSIEFPKEWLASA